MESVTKVKERIAELAEAGRRLNHQLDVSQRETSRLQRERDELRRKVEHAGLELEETRHVLDRERRRHEAIVHEREVLIRDLDAARRELARELHATRQQLARAKERDQELTGRLRNAEQREEGLGDELLLAQERSQELADVLQQIIDERDEAMSELGEATSAFVDIRDQLRVSLEAVGQGDESAHATMW